MQQVGALAECARWLEGTARSHTAAPSFPVVRNAIADFVICALHGAAFPSDTTTALVAGAEAGNDRVLGFERRVSAPEAIFLNAFLGHSHDFDDHCPAGVVHSSVCILPPLLARFESGKLDGVQLTEAFRLASEATFHVGAAVGDELYKRGWFNTTLLGVFGACVAESLARGLTLTTHLESAFELSMAHFFGTRHVLGGVGKPIAVGQAAMLGASLGGILARLPEPLRIDARGKRDFLDLALSRGQNRVSLRAPLKARLLEPGLDLKTAPFCLSAFPFMNLGGAVKHCGTPWESIAKMDFEVSPRAKANLMFTTPEVVHQAPFSALAAFAFGVAGAKALDPRFLREWLTRNERRIGAFTVRGEWEDAPFNADVILRVATGEGVRLQERDPNPARAQMTETDRILRKAETFLFPAMPDDFPKALEQFLAASRADAGLETALRRMLLQVARPPCT
jgi:uncharacterized membrane protein YeaQ/YmgE (transglycosylase-associated protein family)